MMSISYDGLVLLTSIQAVYVHELHVFNMTEHDVAVIFDTDTLLIHAVDNLFDAMLYGKRPRDATTIPFTRPTDT
jgi:alpha-N-acetylglucosamine transferase